MGTNQVKEYAQKMTEGNLGQTGIYRQSSNSKFIQSTKVGFTTFKNIILNCSICFHQRKCLGVIKIKQPESAYIKQITYGQMLNIAIKIGSGIIHRNFATHDEQQNMDLIGIFSNSRIQWTLSDLSCILYGIVTVPISDILADQNITYILKQTKITTIFISGFNVESLILTKDLATLKTLICFDIVSSTNIKLLKERQIQVISFSELIKIGEENEVNYQDYEVKPESCLTLMYTSGTTGNPKGVMISHRNLVSFCLGMSLNKQLQFKKEDVILSYLPLSHILERQVIYYMISVGGKIVYYRGNVKFIKDDLVLVKPTIFIGVPRLFNRFYQIINKKFEQIEEGWTKKFLHYALKVKFMNVQKYGIYSHFIYDQIFFHKTKQSLGGAVRLMISGGAPLRPEINQFMKVVMCTPLLQAYGLTESTGGCFVTSGLDNTLGHIGGPICNTEYKLIDVPSLSYTSLDKNQIEEEMPRGQICIRGPSVFMGYFKDQVKTKQSLTEDGWLLTGDIGVILKHNKALKLIDRKNNIFKLQNGQFIVPQKIQSVYRQSDKLNEVLICGQSTQSFIIVIGNPHKGSLEEIGKKLNISGSYQELCSNKQVRIMILSELVNLGKNAGFESFEQAKNIYLQPLGFMFKGIITNTMKVQRHQAKIVYRDIIKDLYLEGMIPRIKNINQS